VTDRTTLARVSLSGDFVGMPRYFFHVKRGQVTILDQNGVELGSQEEVNGADKKS